MSRRGVTRVAAALVVTLLAACSPAVQDGPITLRWYVGPDRVDVRSLARSCSTASGGDYTIDVVRLPDDVDERHSTLARRLAAKDDSIDLLSLDSAFTTEFDAAGFLAPIPEELKEPFSRDAFPAALQAASPGGQLAAAPWWSDPYLLWFRGLAAERAGLDTTKPITWDALVAGASRVGTSIQIEDPDGQGLASWIDALVVGSGGTLLDGTGRSPRIGLDSEPGQSAADVVRSYAASDLGPGPSADAVRDFVTTPGSFLLAPTSVISDPRLASIAGDMQWTAYPVVDTDPAVPVTGVSLAVPLYAKHTTQSYDAIECLTSDASMQQMMLSSGHSAARASLYDTREVQAGYPMAAVAKKSMEDGLTLPQTPYWNRVRDALVDTWLPVADVDASTPATSQRAVRDEVAGRLR